MTTTENITALPDGTLEPASAGAVHEHGWMVESRHPTSQGWVLYVRCAGCGARRVDLQEGIGVMPEPYSTTVL